MTILVFYPVENALGWERHDFDCMADDAAFKVLWANQDKLYARFYDMDSHYGDRGELDQYIRNADDFETDYNDEELDGGWWCKSLHVPTDFVKQIVLSEE